MQSNNCDCNKFPEATFIRDPDDKKVYVNCLFCPDCFRIFVTDGEYTEQQYYIDKRKAKE